MNDKGIILKRKNADEEFREIALDYTPAQNAWQHILTTMDAALCREDYKALLDLIPYIEKGDGQAAFQYIGKTRRLLLILKILSLEAKSQKALFCQSLNSADALYEKYMLTLFSFRRILFRLSEDSFTEAVTYLQNNPVSHFAAYMITQDDLIVPDQDFYDTLALIFTQKWSVTDVQQFFALINTSIQN